MPAASFVPSTMTALERWMVPSAIALSMPCADTRVAGMLTAARAAPRIPTRIIFFITPPEDARQRGTPQMSCASLIIAKVAARQVPGELCGRASGAAPADVREMADVASGASGYDE